MSPIDQQASESNGKRLEGWTDIADHLQVSPRTARRWEKQTPAIPIYREVINNRPYAWSGDLDQWRNQEAMAIAEPPHSETPLEKGMYDPDPTSANKAYWKWSLFLLVTCIVCALFLNLSKTSSHEESLLHFEQKNHTPGSIIYIRDQNNEIVHTLTDSINNRPEKDQKHMRLCLIDMNRDGREDVVFAPLLSKDGDHVQIFYQKPDHGCSLETSWSAPDQLTYQGKTFQGFQTRWLDCRDLTGDGIPEIILIRVHTDLYPTYCLVFDGGGELLFELRHPGRLLNTYVADRNRNGTPELYIAGTNNFIAKKNFSAPVLIAIERPWAQKGSVDLFGPNRSLTHEVPDDTRLYYLNFKKDYLSGVVSDWEAAFLSDKLDDIVLAIYVGNLTSTEEGFLRHFRLAADLSCTKGYIAADTARRLGVDRSALAAAGLYQPIYWNGLGWQEQVCFLPYASVGKGSTRDSGVLP